MTETGEILAEVMIGNSPRLVRLTEGQACTSNCVRVSQLSLGARFIDDPDDPGQCTADAASRALVRMRVTDEHGVPLGGVSVTGHFFDDYTLDDVHTGTTDPRGGCGSCIMGRHAWVRSHFSLPTQRSTAGASIG